MNITTLSKDEMTSHLAEVLDDQDNQIDTLKTERKVLWYLLAFALTINLIF